MGLFDAFKKKAQDAIAGATTPAAEPPRASAPAPKAAAASRPAPRGATFEWDGDVLPMPEGWANLSMEDWFLKLEQTRDRIMHADEETLEPMNDEEGNPLDPEEVLIIKLGFQTGGHWEKFRNWGAHDWARKQGGRESPSDLEFRMSGIARDKMMAQKAASMSGPGGLLAPVEGVSLKDWARIQASLATGGNLDAQIAALGVDRPTWDRVSNEWMARMQTDTTMTVANEYGAAFAAGSSSAYAGHATHAATAGVAGDLSSEPVSYERYCDMMEAMSASSDRGEDPIAFMASIGLTPVDWGNIGMYWSKRTQQEMTKYHALYVQYSEKYRKKYRGQ